MWLRLAVQGGEMWKAPDNGGPLRSQTQTWAHVLRHSVRTTCWGMKASHKYQHCHDGSSGKWGEGPGMPSGNFPMTHRFVDPLCTPSHSFCHTHTPWDWPVHPPPKRPGSRKTIQPFPKSEGTLSCLGGGNPGQLACKDFIHHSSGSRGQEGPTGHTMGWGECSGMKR